MNYSFQNSVYDYVSQVPVGKVTTYGTIAKACGMHARQVGQILHHNQTPETVPCHRVVQWDGGLATGYAFGGPSVQRAQLEAEGVFFTHDRVNLAGSFWSLDAA